MWRSSTPNFIQIRRDVRKSLIYTSMEITHLYDFHETRTYYPSIRMEITHLYEYGNHLLIRVWKSLIYTIFTKLALAARRDVWKSLIYTSMEITYL